MQTEARRGEGLRRIDDVVIEERLKAAAAVGAGSLACGTGALGAIAFDRHWEGGDA